MDSSDLTKIAGPAVRGYVVLSFGKAAAALSRHRPRGRTYPSPPARDLSEVRRVMPSGP